MSPRAELILSGARIWPGAPGPRAPVPRPFRGAVAVAGGRVLALGPESQIQELRGPDTRILNLEGLLLCPGLQDAHIHLLTGGFKLAALDLRRVRSREAFVQAVRGAVQGLPSGRWVLGGEWDHERWGGPLPHRDWIDEVSREHPLILNRIDMHVALANGRALELAGIDQDTPDPPGGTIHRGEDGRASGLLSESALGLVWSRVPSPSPEEWRRALERASEYLLRRGVTQVHDMGVMERPSWSWTALEVLREARSRGALELRVRTALPVAEWERLADLVAEEGPGDGLLRWDAVKGFADGSLGARTAWFHEPYADRDTHGGPLEDPRTLARTLRCAWEAGLRPIVHAIGDRANDWLLDVYSGLGPTHRAGGWRDGAPFRIEHAQHLTPEALERVGMPSLALSAQPAHLVEDGPWMDRALGGERPARAYPFRTLLDKGARLAFGSDWPVVEPDPLKGVAAAATRRLPEGVADPGSGSREGILQQSSGVFFPHERITPGEALRAYTAGAAWAAGEGGLTGSIAPGKAADFTVLSEDPLSLPPSSLNEVEVVMTIVDGRVRYSREEEG